MLRATLVFCSLLGTSLLALSGLAQTSPPPIASGTPVVLNTGSELGVAFELINQGTTVAQSLTVTSVASGTLLIKQPATFPVALGDISPGTSQTLDLALTMPSTVAAGSKILITVRGYYLFAGVQTGLTVNRFISVPPPIIPNGLSYSAFVNKNDPLALEVKEHDGATTDYFVTRALDGTASQLSAVARTDSLGRSSWIFFDSAGNLSRMEVSNGVVFQFGWGLDGLTTVTATQPDGYQVSTVVDLSGASAVSQTTSGKINALQRPSTTATLPSDTTVLLCGKPVDDARVLLDVSPALGHNYKLPTVQMSPGVYQASLPLQDPTANPDFLPRCESSVIKVLSTLCNAKTQELLGLACSSSFGAFVAACEEGTRELEVACFFFDASGLPETIAELYCSIVSIEDRFLTFSGGAILQPEVTFNTIPPVVQFGDPQNFPPIPDFTVNQNPSDPTDCCGTVFFSIPQDEQVMTVTQTLNDNGVISIRNNSAAFAPPGIYMAEYAIHDSTGLPFNTIIGYFTRVNNQWKLTTSYSFTKNIPPPAGSTGGATQIETVSFANGILTESLRFTGLTQTIIGPVTYTASSTGLTTSTYNVVSGKRTITTHGISTNTTTTQQNTSFTSTQTDGTQVFQLIVSRQCQ